LRTGEKYKTSRFKEEHTETMGSPWHI